MAMSEDELELVKNFDIDDVKALRFYVASIGKSLSTIADFFTYQRGLMEEGEAKQQQMMQATAENTQLWQRLQELGLVKGEGDPMQEMLKASFDILTERANEVEAAKPDASVSPLVPPDEVV